MHPYLGVHISSDLRWNTHVDTVSAKSTRVLNLLRRNLYNCCPEVKARAYLSIVRPTLNYASTVWDPFTLRNINKLEMVQRRAARFTLNRYSRQESVSAMLADLNWPCLESLRKSNRLLMLYKILNGHVAIDADEFVTFSTTSTRRKHRFKLNVLSPSLNSYKYSFFPRTIPEWNDLPSYIAEASSVHSFRCLVQT